MIRPDVKFELVREFIGALGFPEPSNVSEIRLRAPSTIEVLVYARDHDGAKFIGDDGIALERITLRIVREQTDDEPSPPLGLVL